MELDCGNPQQCRAEEVQTDGQRWHPAEICHVTDATLDRHSGNKTTAVSPGGLTCAFAVEDDRRRHRESDEQPGKKAVHSDRAAHGDVEPSGPIVAAVRPCAGNDYVFRM